MLSGSNSLSYYSKVNLSIWFSMAFQAGAINAGGFIACHRFVSHTTGFATYFGTEAAQGNLHAAFGMLSVPLFFLLGAVTSAYFVDRRIFLEKRPLYHWMFAAIALLMTLVAVAGTEGAFSAFGEVYDQGQDYALVAILCFCSGLQNGTITSASGAVVRTTHLTGITTDLGIGLVRIFSRPSGKLKSDEIRANWMRTGIILMFIFGSTVAAALFYRFQYLGFLGPALISAGLFVFALNKLKNSQLPTHSSIPEAHSARISQ